MRCGTKAIGILWRRDEDEKTQRRSENTILTHLMFSAANGKRALYNIKEGSSDNAIACSGTKRVSLFNFKFILHVAHKKMEWKKNGTFQIQNYVLKKNLCLQGGLIGSQRGGVTNV